MRQLIHIDKLANSPTSRLMLACPIAIPTLVIVKDFIGESDQVSNTDSINGLIEMHFSRISA